MYSLAGKGLSLIYSVLEGTYTDNVAEVIAAKQVILYLITIPYIIGIFYVVILYTRSHKTFDTYMYVTPQVVGEILHNTNVMN